MIDHDVFERVTIMLMIGWREGRDGCRHAAEQLMRRAFDLIPDVAAMRTCIVTWAHLVADETGLDTDAHPAAFRLVNDARVGLNVDRTLAAMPTEVAEVVVADLIAALARRRLHLEVV